MRLAIRICVLCIYLFSIPIYAQDAKSILRPSQRYISEYFYSRTGSEILTPVRILSGVNLPGIYHVPANTDMATLISIAGGVDIYSDPKRIKYTPAGKETVKVNLDRHLEKGKEIYLNAGDIVYVEKREGIISQEASITLTTIVSILSLGLTAYVIDRTID